MKRQLTIGKKITLSFSSILLLLLLIGLFSEFGVRRIVTNAEQLIDGNRLDGFLAQMEVDHLNWANRINAQLNDINVTSFTPGDDHRGCRLGQWLVGTERTALQESLPSLAPLLTKLETTHKELHDSAIQIGEVFSWADPNLPTRFVAIEAEHLRWLGRLRGALLENDRNLRGVQKDPEQCSFGKWQRTAEGRSAYQKGSENLQETWDELSEVHVPMHRSAVKLEKFLADGNFNLAREYVEETIAPLVEENTVLFRELANVAEEDLAGIRQARSIYAEHTLPALAGLQSGLVTIRQEAKRHRLTDEALVDSARNTRLSVIVTTMVTLLGGILLAFVVQRGISRALIKLTSQVEIGANQTATAVEEVAAASSSLADGASQQAAATEEISSSLEEITSMTRNDAEHARQADNLMHEAAKVVTEADTSMQRLTESMHDISAASEETKKIVKTIDEIAFQTNLLALNAAVEAARAGEAGAGFAVVADEVRNLAMRAASSAKTTSQLIDNTVAKISTGSELVAATSDSFTMVTETTAKISSLISEIASSTGEQSIAIQHVNKGVMNIDSVTQQNVATAEEVAAAAEELRAQADASREVVQELVAMVGGQGHTATSNPGRHRPAALPPPQRQAPHKPAPQLERPKPPSASHVADDQSFEDF